MVLYQLLRVKLKEVSNLKLSWMGKIRQQKGARNRKLVRLAKIRVFHCGRKMSGRAIRLRSRPDDHSWVNQRSRLHMHQEQSLVTGRQMDEMREKGVKGREGKRERQCRELALNPIALCGTTTGFY